MNPADSLTRLGSLAHRHLLLLVAVAYVLAAVGPATGLWAKHFTVVGAGGAALTLPMLLLAVLLFNASIGASVRELGNVVRRPVPILAGVVVNVLTPVAFLLLLRFGLRAWHDTQEAESLLLGLTVVAAMPVAGSSTAWSHNAGGNIALSLGLVVVSTLLSPVTTPLVLAGVGGGEAGGPGHGVVGFLLAVVVVPSALGLLARWLIGDRAATRLKPTLKAANAVVLLALCYINASVALPQVVADPDWDYLALVGASASGLCLTAFAAGWVLARVLRAGEADGRALVFGLGMSNNGTGLVMAGASLGTLPWAVVPVLAYNLVQHVIAAGIARSLAPRERKIDTHLMESNGTR